MDLESLWWFGAIIYVIGSILINLGSNLIRKNHGDISMLEEGVKPPPLYKRTLWLAGFSIFAVGNVMNFVAFMFAAQSLCAALGSVQFVSNLFFAAFINHETVRRRDVAATSGIIVGNVIIVIFGSKDSENYTLDELWDLLLRPQFIIYMAFLVGLVAVLQILYWAAVLYLKHRYETDDAEEPELALQHNRLEAAAQRYIPFAYAAVSAIIGTNSILLGKMSAGLIVQMTQPGGLEMWLTVWPYLLCGLFLLVIVFWLYRMNTALRLYDALFIIPVLQTIWLIFGVMSGGIFFEEFASLSSLDMVAFFIGIVILVLGVSILAPASAGDGDSHDYATEIIEEDEVSWMVDSIAHDEDLPGIEMQELFGKDLWDEAEKLVENDLFDKDVGHSSPSGRPHDGVGITPGEDFVGRVGEGEASGLVGGEAGGSHL